MDTPLGDFFNSEEIREIERDNSLLFEDRGDKAMMAHRERPYLGQLHTDHGERGKTEVKGLTMRDIADCIARGFAQAVRPEDKWTFSEEAMVQCAMVNVEKMMGIFPNVPPLEEVEDLGGKQ